MCFKMTQFAKFDLKARVHKTSVPDSSDNWDRASTRTDWTIPDEFFIRGKNEYGSVPINFKALPGQDYFIVYYIWSTGDSFGHDANYHCEVHDIYETEAAALQERERLSKVTDHSVPWNGHFESLSSLEVKRVTANTKRWFVSRTED